MIRFDPTGPLPSRTALLEASAGTGKTHAIAALATRYLAESVVPADRLTVISFSRAASSELRSRVRQRLLATRALLVAAAQGQPLGDLDPTDALLTSGDVPTLLDRHARLVTAVGELDGAAIMTIHEFCQAMMAELGVLADADPRARLVEDITSLRDQLTADLYLARYGGLAEGPPFSLETARALAADAVDFGQARLVPTESGGVAAERLAFAQAVRDMLAERKRRLGLYTFDDQLLRLRDSLAQAGSQAAVERLRRRCQVVLVDEFQDTDPVQWSILQQAFDGHRPLVLIGDPKQSIYGFRGADDTAYRRAVAVASDRYSLAVNHRADPGIVQATNALFEGVELGTGIVVPEVEAARADSRLAGTAPPVARIRCIAPSEPLDAASAREWITADLIGQVHQLLAGTELATSTGTRRLQAADIAVLVTSNLRGQSLADALTESGIAVAFSGSESVFASDAAKDWLALLRALIEPQRQHTRAAVLTDFIGGDLHQLATADDARLSEWGAVLQRWSRLLEGDGVAAVFASTQQHSRLVERIVGQPFGERRITDFRHLAELLQTQYATGLRGQALLNWLAESIADAGRGANRTRRLETDRRAVQIMTVHKAKGLQFPVVLIPEATNLYLGDDKGAKLVFHADDGERVLDLGGLGTPGRAERHHRHELEAAADRLRALYVAVTRAESQVTLWWARTKRNTEASPLHRLLCRDRGAGGTPEPWYPVDRHPREFDWLVPAGIAVEDCPPPHAVRHWSEAVGVTQLAAPRWERQIDQSWRRTSYSGLTAAVHAGAFPPVDASVLRDEPADSGAPEAIAVGTPSPMATLPGGAAFGSLVHDVLEKFDWYAPTPQAQSALRERLRAATRDALARFPLADVTADGLADALLPSLLTPLGSLTGGRSLAQLPTADRLSELDFEYPLGHSSSTTTLAEVADLLRRWLPPGDPLAGYPDELARPGLGEQVLRGFLTGSIDSVLRVTGEAGPRFVVVDYKTNRIGGETELFLEHYREQAMASEMIRSHYPLQALVYCVALHRFLSQRLTGYAPERHLGGVGYLFVRGMAGAAPEQDTSGEPETGVFRWFPPAGLVTELSELIADRRPR